jgi:alpha-1,3/alpha-1,6-mannosyltransferase
MPNTVSFIHLDLGIGGAENLVINAAKGLQKKGHNVTIYTSHHDPSRAFKETIDGTIKVVVYGSWIPRQIFGRFTILLSTVRMIYICIMMLINSQLADVVFTDQVSSINPIVRLFGLAKSKLIFYCHYPDVLLCTIRGSIFKRAYRVPFDFLEQYTTSVCDVLLVNSEFTAETLRSTFPNIQQKVRVLYPPIDTESAVKGNLPSELEDKKYFLSLNRYERKKDLGLVIESFADFLKSKQLKTGSPVLVIAGGYDPRLVENVEYYKELVDLANQRGVLDKVVFIKNVSDDIRQSLLERAMGVVYSPQGEHFGIVPCEAMSAGTPVIAWNNGGPKESIVNGSTGYLCNKKEEFAKSMVKIAGLKPEEILAMSQRCKKRIVDNFSLRAFTDRLAVLAIKS